MTEARPHRHVVADVYTAAGLFLSAMGALALAIVTGVVLVAAPGVVPSVAAYLAAAVPTLAGILALAGATRARKQTAASPAETER
jgi:hypothetical protein